MGEKQVDRLQKLETVAKQASGELESGLMGPPGAPATVAYASLGKTDVSIHRGTDGRVRVEIQDEADEDVYVSINAYTVTSHMDTFTPERPWNT